MSTEPSEVLSVSLFPFRKGQAARAEIVVPAVIEDVWEKLCEIEKLPEIVPVLEFAEKKIGPNGLWECVLEGKIGIWKLGFPLRLHYLMKVEPLRSMEMEQYLGGIFPDVYFRHELEPLGNKATRLTSIYYFDLEGFSVLKILRFAQKFPWIKEIINLSAAALLVRGFGERWWAHDRCENRLR